MAYIILRVIGTTPLDQLVLKYTLIPPIIPFTSKILTFRDFEVNQVSSYATTTTTVLDNVNLKIILKLEKRK